MANLDHLVDLTEQLIRFRTTADRPDQLKACADMCAAYFDGTGLTVERIESEGVPSVFVSKAGKQDPRVLLCGHMDVVEGEDDQFTPRREGDRLYGRGCLDMKSGDAVLMALMKDLAATSHDVGLLLTGDEEVGGFHGVGEMLKRGVSCQVALIPDGGLGVDRVVAKEKGILWLRLTAKGRPAHGARPWEGENAVLKLGRCLDTVEKAFMPLEAHPDDHWVATCNVGLITGGHAVNSVPSEASATCDIRFTENDKPADIIRRVKDALPSGIEVTEVINEPYVLVPWDHALVKAYREAIARQGLEAAQALDHGTSDARFFMPRNIPVILSQPLGGNQHAKGEWVDMPSIGRYYDILRDYVETNA
jgi:succinyl-diaminopimelate desuccinylase